MQARRAVNVVTSLKRAQSVRRQDTGNLNSLKRQGSDKGSSPVSAISPRSPDKDTEPAFVDTNLEDDFAPLSDADMRQHLFERDKDLHAVNKRVERLQMILDKRHTDNHMTVDEIGNKNLKNERTIDQFLHLVEKRIEIGFRYSSCIALTIFVFVYVIAVFMQLDVKNRYSIESPVLSTLIGDLDLETRSLRSSNDLYQWMSSQLVEQIFQDPVCGDGVCEAPEEYAGFGRFGCERDCGRFLNTTTVSVKLSTFAAMSRHVGWDLSRVRRGIDPNFKFNIWSHSMGDFLFTEDQTPNGTTLVLDLPDGSYDVRLYQTAVISGEVDDAATFSTLGVLPDTLPLRDAANDFSYGDRREAFAAAALFARQIEEHCWGGSLLDFDFNCLEYPEVDTLIKLLGSYGVRGEVTTSTGPRQSTTIATVDVSSPGCAMLPLPCQNASVCAQHKFCGMVPDGLAGLRNTSNKEALKAASTPCGGRRHDALQGDEERQGRAQRQALQEAANSARSRHAHDAKGGDEHGRSQDVDAEEEGGGARRLLQLSGREGACVWHDMCDQSVVDRVIAAPGMFCTAAGYCDTCSFCQRDATDSIDGACPLAKCPEAGGLPACLDGELLSRGWSCPSSISFQVRSFSQPGDAVSVKPPPVDKMRYVTPNTRLVGAAVISQVRQKRGVCTGIINEAVQALVSTEGCMESVDDAPFGLDSMFVPTSDLYNGKLNAADYYLPSERTNSTTLQALPGGRSAMVTELSVPHAFFPHKHDSATGRNREEDVVHEGHRDSFMVFLDARLSQAQAKVIHSFLEGGQFLSQYTRTVSVQVPMYNAELNYFALASFRFEWLVGGRMFWDYDLQSFSVDVYQGAAGSLRMAFEIVAASMLILNLCFEAWDILYHFRTMTLGDYLFAGGNLVDWTHFGMSIYAWQLWLSHLQLTSSFTIRPAYAVLLDPVASERPLLTDSTQELAMLQLISDLETMAESFATYSAVAGVVVILFIMRVIKALDFQPRLAIVSAPPSAQRPALGPVTKSISKALTDLAHFVMLFALVHAGYAAAGTLLFGHQFQGFSTVEAACQTLTMAILTMDRTQFYQQMNHAAPEWAFHIYLWSYILLSYMLLVNMFLSILVDAYLAAKQDTPTSLPIPEEVWGLVVHAWRAATAPKSQFLSDWRLREILERRKQGLPSTLALRSAVLSTVDLDFAVHLAGGLLVSPKTLAKLVDEPRDAQEPKEGGTPRPLLADPDAEEEEEEGGSSEDDDGWEGGIDGRVRDLLERYGGAYKGGGALDDEQEQMLMEVLECEDLEIQVLHHQRQAALLPDMERSRVLLQRIIPRITTDLTVSGRPRPAPVKRSDTLAQMGQVRRDDESDDEDKKEELPGVPNAQEGEGEGDGDGAEQALRARKEAGVVWLDVTIVEGEGLPMTDKLGQTDAVYCAATMADAIGEELFREQAARTRAVQKGARWSWEEKLAVRARTLLPGEEEKLLTVMVMGEQGSLGEGVLGVVQVNVRALIEGTLLRAPSAAPDDRPTIERSPSPEAVESSLPAEGARTAGGAGDAAGVVTEMEGWYKVVHTHRPKAEIESARLHLKVCRRASKGPEESALDSTRDTDRSHLRAEQHGEPSPRAGRCSVM